MSSAVHGPAATTTASAGTVPAVDVHAGHPAADDRGPGAPAEPDRDPEALGPVRPGVGGRGRHDRIGHRDADGHDALRDRGFQPAELGRPEDLDRQLRHGRPEVAGQGLHDGRGVGHEEQAGR